MKPSPANDLLAEVWAVKDALSAKHGHSLKATCRALFAEQRRNPGAFVNLGQPAAPRKRRTRPAAVAA